MAHPGQPNAAVVDADRPKPDVVSNADQCPTFRRIVQRPSYGFTLIEIAVVLGIVGLLLYFGIGIVSSLRESTTVRNTELRLAKAQESIMSFVAENFRLPCPANGSVASGASNYGVEVAFVAGSCSAVGANGIVPWVTLGLSDDEALDGFARRISYRVATFAPAPDDPALWRTTLPGLRGLITIHSDTPVGLGLPPPTTRNQINACTTTPGDNSCNNFAVAVLLSHGANGSGAFLPGIGNRVPLPLGAREIENTDGDNAFVQRGFVQDPTLPAGEFDDIVVALSPGNVLTPLIQSDTIKTATGVVQHNVSVIKAAVMGAILSDTLNHVPPAPGDDAGEAVVPVPDSGVDLCTPGVFCLPASAQRDPWNRLMRYTVDASYPAQLEETTPDGPAFSIWSAGWDGARQLLRTDVTIGEVKGWLTMAGVDLPPVGTGGAAGAIAENP